jgi:pimeloyl-ACP methyl ester carboxylesterase
MAKHELNKVELDGAELSYLEVGEGDPVVMVHGSLDDFRTWSFQLGPFSSKYRVLAYSRRYHWPNEWSGDGSDYTAALHSKDLEALIGRLGLAPVHIIGASFGAYVACLFAARHPESVRSLVLAEPPLLPWLADSPEGTDLLADFLARAWFPSGQAFRRGPPEQGVEDFIRGVMGEDAFETLPPHAMQVMLDNAPEMKLETQGACYLTPFTCEEARRITAPALLLDGEFSPRLFYVIEDELERCIPECERRVISGVGHAMHAQDPEAYNAVVLDFLERH